MGSLTSRESVMQFTLKLIKKQSTFDFYKKLEVVSASCCFSKGNKASQY